MPAKTERKILQSGDSKVMALPPDWLRAFNLKIGDVIEILYDSVILIRPKGLKLDADFLNKELGIMINLEKDMPRTRDFVKLRKQGNSLVVTIPKGIIETLKWNPEEELYLEVQNDSLTIKKS